MNGVSFRLDLNDLRHHFKALNAFASGAAPGVQLSPSPWNAWLQGSVNAIRDNSAGTDRSGEIFALSGGASYRFSNRLTAGIITRYRTGEITSTALASRLRSDYYSIGAFAQALLQNRIRFDGLLAYEFGDSDISIAGATGSYDTRSLTAAAKLSRRWNFDDRWFEPNVSIIYIRTNRDGYTDSAATFVPGRTGEQVRLAFGPRFGFNLMPHFDFQDSVKQADFEFGVNGVWNLTRSDPVTLSTGAITSDPALSASLSSSLNLVMENGMSLGFGVNYSRHGSLNVYGGHVKLSIPLN